MTTIIRTLTNWEERYHLQYDADASVLDAFVIELPPYTIGHEHVVRLESGKTMEDLQREALTTLAWLRQLPWKPVHPANHFIPIGVITARDYRDLWREHEIKREMMLGICTDRDRARMEAANLNDSRQFHERRVASLCKALDLLDGKVQMPETVPWPTNLRHMREMN